MEQDTECTARILLVEDNAADVYLLRRALEAAQLRCELTIFEDGSSAISFIEAHVRGSLLPDLAILDLNLPKQSGWQVLARLRASPHLQNVPVIILSSSPSPGERDQITAAGVQIYLIKPPDLDGFLNLGFRIREILWEHFQRSPRESPGERPSV